LHKDFGTQQMERASQLLQAVGNLGKDLAFCVGDLVGRRKIHRTTHSNAHREFWLYFLCRSGGSLCSEDDRFDMSYDFFVIGVPFFSMESPRNLEHFVAREQ